MRRFHIKRKISDTLLGATYECERVRDFSLSDVMPTYTSSVAIKCCSLTIAEDATVPKERLIDHPHREEQVITKLITSGGHRNVLQCYDHFVADDMVYFVSEYCAGGDLYQHLSTFPNGTMDEATAMQTLTQIADGVVYLHSLGFAHRDLSLENVLLRHGEWKIADFGLSTQVNERTSDCAGKDYYMAPEVVAQESYDPAKADVWSLGIMLFVMLTGSQLLPVASPKTKSFSVVVSFGIGAILTAWGMRENVSDAVVGLLERMLQVDPVARMSMAEVVASLSALVAA
ncbi:hypothetical protein Poli38472_011728 [Pythium oligandrum]|uniref:Protein kinase domain-containing protein n=1 Tax=Pythium oligandrum TaxID=41045 RepID=A0A8K1FCB3_PYTOL|nr:hypothetical protein Poli38472_011728 [Pythium oligandrum]|eukprot:TMW58140.1 hypothetical protein Poli38472_011728 [Pythium oligandrum]